MDFLSYSFQRQPEILRVILTFFTFTESFFLFYYTSLLAASSKNILPMKEPKNIFYVLIAPLLVLFIWYVNHDSVDTKLRAYTQKVLDKSYIIKLNKVNEQR